MKSKSGHLDLGSWEFSLAKTLFQAKNRHELI